MPRSGVQRKELACLYAAFCIYNVLVVVLGGVNNFPCYIVTSSRVVWQTVFSNDGCADIHPISHALLRTVTGFIERWSLCSLPLNLGGSP